MGKVLIFVIKFYILMQGMPRGGQFRHHADLVLVCTSIIFTCSAQHKAVNASQYNEYAFPPNYPIYLAGQPPVNRVSGHLMVHVYGCTLDGACVWLYT